ncbi:hypothetical protein VOI54_00785 [Tamlana sp. 2201CG12-4]|uniref:hypothetical protein n=1 Tax=Tamlana sp. 2201CG12-4 TaxID=3112582 RepID=UPI002DBF470D|nr:hypothetical protein [Tamlana sp. 2201CG12-4]MEC3905543.1 hypothetical protein [Tamlana sp. 2201CG12-4]
MTLYEFNILSFEEKQAIVHDIGIFLDNYVTTDIRINCYAIDKFFVELVYNSEFNTITEVRSFKCGHEMEKYSPDIFKYFKTNL